jgi:hypothetical protein
MGALAAPAKMAINPIPARREEGSGRICEIALPSVDRCNHYLVFDKAKDGMDRFSKSDSRKNAGRII